MKRLTYILLLAAYVLSSCTKDKPTTSDPVRVLLVYVGTNNNLSGYEQAKLQGLRDGWTGNKNDRIIAYVDKGQGAPARLIEISNLAPDAQPREIATYGDENSASGDVFGRVITDVKVMFPNADSYGLLLFSHASGWLPEGALADPHKNDYSRTRSLLARGDSEMGLMEFAAAIPDGFFDYIAFEMCFMAGIEVAYELRHKTPYILASSAEILHPGFAPIYAASTRELLAGNLSRFGKDIFEHTQTYAADNPQRSATYSIIRTAVVDDLTAFVKQSCDPNRAVSVAEVQHFDRYAYRLFFDFEDYYSRLLETDEQRATLSRLIDNCIVWRAATTEFMNQGNTYNGFTINRHSGLTTYIPQPQFSGLNAEYSKLGWSKAIN